MYYKYWSYLILSKPLTESILVLNNISRKLVVSSVQFDLDRFTNVYFRIAKLVMMIN